MGIILDILAGPERPQRTYSPNSSPVRTPPEKPPAPKDSSRSPLDPPVKLRTSQPPPFTSNPNPYPYLWSESSKLPPPPPPPTLKASPSSNPPSKPPSSASSNLTSYSYLRSDSESSKIPRSSPPPSSKANPSSSTLSSKPNPSSSTLSSWASSNTVRANPEIFDASIFAPTPPSPSSKASESERIDRQITPQRYEVPEDLQKMFEMGIVPEILKKPLSPETYATFFATLLYSEDFYIERWSNFILYGVTLELRSRAGFEDSRALHSRAAFDNSQKTKKTNKSTFMNKNDFVAFEVNSVPEKRPYLLSRDFVFLRPLDKKTELFKGILSRVVKSTTVLVEFGDDFHSQHLSTKKYDVSFSFNRVCLKREHQAISTELKNPLPNILFPDPVSTSSSFNSSSYVNHPYGSLNQGQVSAATRILNHKGPLPYLVEGPLSVMHEKLTSMGAMLQEAILKIYETSAHCRILICAPMNRTCDALIRSLREEIPRSTLFRANAAFRDYELVPGDIIQESLYKEEKECFVCPPLSELQNFQVITSTFVSSFRLYAAGITADHFSHIFLVDASSVTEPEAAVALVHLVGKKTVTVVTGSAGNSPLWVRSDLSRAQGLKRSYFRRLLEREPYRNRDPMFIAHLHE